MIRFYASLCTPFLRLRSSTPTFASWSDTISEGMAVSDRVEDPAALADGRQELRADCGRCATLRGTGLRYVGGLRDRQAFRATVPEAECRRLRLQHPRRPPRGWFPRLRRLRLLRRRPAGHPGDLRWSRLAPEPCDGGVDVHGLHRDATAQGSYSGTWSRPGRSCPPGHYARRSTMLGPKRMPGRRRRRGLGPLRRLGAPAAGQSAAGPGQSDGACASVTACPTEGAPI